MALEESARLLAEANTHAVDIGLCNGRPFLLWAGVGLDAFVVHRIEPRNRWEKHFAVVHYAASTVWNASFWHGANLRIQVDGKEISGHYLLALVSNIHLYGGGLVELSPDARLDDGLMDLWLFDGETLGDTVQRAWDMISGRTLQSEHIFHTPFRRLSLESDSPQYIQVDGEPASGDGAVSIEILPRSLVVFIPPNPPHLLLQDHPLP
jgi:diacylglycerol kinase family enzyme